MFVTNQCGGVSVSCRCYRDCHVRVRLASSHYGSFPALCSIVGAPLSPPLSTKCVAPYPPHSLPTPSVACWVSVCDRIPASPPPKASVGLHLGSPTGGESVGNCPWWIGPDWWIEVCEVRGGDVNREICKQHFWASSLQSSRRMKA